MKVSTPNTKSSFPITLESLQQQLEAVDRLLKGRDHEDIYRCAIVLMASVVIGNDVEHLAAFTQYPREFLNAISTRMQEAELWVDDLIRCEHWNDKNGKNRFDLDFWMDTLVAHGSWSRELDECGNYQYEQVGPEPEDLEFIQ